MPISDPIADMLTRIRNANGVGKRRVRVKRSIVCLGVARVLKEEGYIADYLSTCSA
jgi:small subunit ribosomal protein S8